MRELFNNNVMHNQVDMPSTKANKSAAYMRSSSDNSTSPRQVGRPPRHNRRSNSALNTDSADNKTPAFGVNSTMPASKTHTPSGSHNNLPCDWCHKPFDLCTRLPRQTSTVCRHCKRPADQCRCKTHASDVRTNNVCSFCYQSRHTCVCDGDTGTF